MFIAHPEGPLKVHQKKLLRWRLLPGGLADRSAIQENIRKMAPEILEQAYAHLANCPELGSYAWFVRTKPLPGQGHVVILDYEYSLAVAALIRLGIDPRVSAALVHLDYVCAFPDDKPWVPDCMRDEWLTHLVTMRMSDGSLYAVMAKQALWSFDPQLVLGPNGYCVSASKLGRLVSGLVAKSVRSALEPCADGAIFEFARGGNGSFFAMSEQEDQDVAA